MIGVVYDARAYSFSKVARLTVEGFVRSGFERVLKTPYLTTLALPPLARLIYVYDTTAMYSRSWTRFTADRVIVWTDSSIDPESFSPAVPDDCCHVQCHPFWASLYRRLGIRTDGWIPRPVDDDAVSAVLSVPREELCAPVWAKYGRRYAINVATEIPVPYPRPRKGLDMYDRLCSELEIPCLYVGNLDLGHAVRVSTTGGLPESALLRLVRCAEVFVWTSRSEGFGMPPVEAMAVGTPVVCSSAPFNSLIHGYKFPYREEATTRTHYGFSFRIWDYDYRDLRDAVLEALADDPAEREARAREASESARSFFSKVSVAHALAEL